MYPLPQLNTIGLRSDFRTTGGQNVAKHVQKRVPLGEIGSGHGNLSAANGGHAGADSAQHGDVKAAGKPSPRGISGTWGFAMLAPEHQKDARRQDREGGGDVAPSRTSRISPTLASSPHLKPQLAMGGVGASLSVLEIKNKGRNLPRLDAVSQSTSSLPPSKKPQAHDGGAGEQGWARHRYDSIAPAGRRRMAPSASNEDVGVGRNEVGEQHNQARPLGTGRFQQGQHHRPSKNNAMNTHKRAERD